jgi:predicted metal-binding protein
VAGRNDHDHDGRRHPTARPLAPDGARHRAASGPVSSQRARSDLTPMTDLTVPAAVAPAGCTLHVCTTCRRPRPDLAEGYDQPGIALAQSLEERLAGSGIPVVPVECLSVCKRPCTVALVAEGKWTYVIGDLDRAEHVEDIADAALRYAASQDGIVPWRERPVCIRKGVVARVPPLRSRRAHRTARRFVPLFI